VYGLYSLDPFRRYHAYDKAMYILDFDGQKLPLIYFSFKHAEL